MSDLARIASKVGKLYNYYLYREFSKLVVEATWPWRFETLTTYLDMDSEFLGNYIVVEIRFDATSDWVFYIRQPIPPAPSEEEVLYLVGEAFKERFRNWREEPPSNIELGEY